MYIHDMYHCLHFTEGTESLILHVSLPSSIQTPSWSQLATLLVVNAVYNYIMNYRVHMYMYVEAGTRRPVTCRVCVSTST